MSVCLGMLTVELHIPESHSLKERRSVVNSLKEKIRKRCNVSIADLSPDNVWQRAELCFSSAGETQSNVDTAFRGTIEIMDNEMRCELLNSRIEYYACSIFRTIWKAATPAADRLRDHADASGFDSPSCQTAR